MDHGRGDFLVTYYQKYGTLNWHSDTILPNLVGLPGKTTINFKNPEVPRQETSHIIGQRLATSPIKVRDKGWKLHNLLIASRTDKAAQAKLSLNLQHRADAKIHVLADGLSTGKLCNSS
ncbi:hypothetical protein HPB48_011400 [Haemaphysalis longicornis]|uniref:Uncharacterized protein n=1 Tax=Haemaphysalis longicornis TaxID=44386 RepID=A0A9J6GH22_HAELO|nr:hypothetical protein HPB48_011400 [Haemaphysalis longicornis]